MILQALCGYYDRLAADPDSGVCSPGYSVAPVGACIVLDRLGRVVSCQPLTEQKGKKTVPMRLIVPQRPKRTGNVAPAFMCDNISFVFGIGEVDSARRGEALGQLHHTILDGVDDEGAKALLAFLDNRTIGEYGDADGELLSECGNIVFRLQGEPTYLHEREAIKDAWIAYKSQEAENAEIGECLVTGKTGPIARLHPNFTGFGEDKPSLVSFKPTSFQSRGKSQGANAPISEDAASRYGIALNHLLSDSRHCVSISKDKVVFWAERDAHEEESLLHAMFYGFTEEPEKDKSGIDEKKSDEVRGKLLSLMMGRKPEDISLDSDVRVYVLGLSANRSRLVVRFFERNTFNEIVGRIRQHYNDTELVDARPRYPSLFKLMIESVPLGKSENIPPNLSGATLRAILTGCQYPAALYGAMLNRIRAEASKGNSANSTRVGLLRGYLNRGDRLKNKKESISMGLDITRTDKAYRLGRVFAVFEVAQREALGTEINATIVDKYLNAAMATPQMVFPSLMKLFEKHVSKSGRGYRRQLVEEILWDIDEYPRTLDLRAQSEFILGYYHQKKALYAPKNTQAAQNSEAEKIMEERNNG